MSSVEGLRGDADHPAHGFGQIDARCFENPMKMIGHQAVGMAKSIEPAKRLSKDCQERILVDVIDKGGGLGITARRHVVDGSGKFYAKRSGHAKITCEKSRFKI